MSEIEFRKSIIERKLIEKYTNSKDYFLNRNIIYNIDEINIKYTRHEDLYPVNCIMSGDIEFYRLKFIIKSDIILSKLNIKYSSKINVYINIDEDFNFINFYISINKIEYKESDLNMSINDILLILKRFFSKPKIILYLDYYENNSNTLKMHVNRIFSEYQVYITPEKYFKYILDNQNSYYKMNNHILIGLYNSHVFYLLNNKMYPRVVGYKNDRELIDGLNEIYEAVDNNIKFFEDNCTLISPKEDVIIYYKYSNDINLVYSLLKDNFYSKNHINDHIFIDNILNKYKNSFNIYNILPNFKFEYSNIKCEYVNNDNLKELSIDNKLYSL